MKDLSIPTLKEGLERRYQSCLSIEPSFDLAVALHSYVQYLNNHPVLDYLFTEKIQADARKLLAQIAEEETKAEKQLEAVFTVVEKRFEKKKIEHERVRRELDGYKDNRNGRITKDVYDIKHQEHRDQIQTLEIELSEHSKADYDYQTTVATVISVARRARTIFENSSEPAGKRAFLNFLLQNPIVDGKKLYFSIASPFNLVLELADSPTWLAVSS